MNRIRTRLILVFAAATLLPLAATLWITKSLLEHSLTLTATRELDQLSESLEQTGRALYQSARESLRAEVRQGTAPRRFYRAAEEASWPEVVREFYAGGQNEQFRLSGPSGDRLDLLLRRDGGVAEYSRAIGGPGMHKLSSEYAKAKSLVQRSVTHDLRRGFVLTLIVLAAAVWIVSLFVLVLWARRISRPIERLTAGLQEVASGNLGVRLQPGASDEVGRAMDAFNNTVEQLQQSRDRLVHVTRLSSWQTLARKMAHEVKNSLTPIRLTMEEVLARRGERDDGFLEQAAQIIIDEVTTLERRVRAFSEFSAEPPVHIDTVDLKALLDERIAFLGTANPGVAYKREHSQEPVVAKADEDLLRGVLTNLLENAAHAAGTGGVVLGKTYASNGKVSVEIHDSGPGLSEHARESLFEPTISFKKAGMGLGLSIAKRSALLLQGDINLVEGDLGGAAFRVQLPRADQNGS